MNTNILKPLANAICISCKEPCQDNSLRIMDYNISYGTIMINDWECMYIKIQETTQHKEVLFDVSMPAEAYAKCRYEVQIALEAILKEI